MNNRPLIIGLIAVVIVIALAAWGFSKPSQLPVTQTGTVATSTSPEDVAFDSSTSDGTIIVSYPSEKFGLATNKTQILVHAYIPPCGENFSYCLYATSTAYAGTNFESAGLRIQKRADLATERVCLDTPPSGYSSTVMPDASTTAAQYSSSEFASVGDAGAGHYASGSLYRLFYRPTSSCYELETRIGETQFANYPAGAIKQFTDADRAAVKTELGRILARITLQSGQSNLFAF